MVSGSDYNLSTMKKNKQIFLLTITILAFSILAFIIFIKALKLLLANFLPYKQGIFNLQGVYETYYSIVIYLCI